MTIGPVQLVVVGLENDRLKGQVARELHRASDNGAIRVLDALAIQKTQSGEIVSLGASDLTADQRMQYGAVVGGLLGLGATGTAEGATVGAELGAEAFADRNFGLSSADIQAVAADIPPGLTTLMVLFEHRWAIPLKEAVEEGHGVVLAQGMVRPEDLIMLGETLAEAEALADQSEATRSIEGQMH